MVRGRVHAAHPQRPTVSCPYCGHTGDVAVRREIGLCNWASAVLMALLGFIPCCIIPFCCTRCPAHIQRTLLGFCAYGLHALLHYVFLLHQASTQHFLLVALGN